MGWVRTKLYVQAHVGARVKQGSCLSVLHSQKLLGIRGANEFHFALSRVLAYYPHGALDVGCYGASLRSGSA